MRVELWSTTQLSLSFRIRDHKNMSCKGEAMLVVVSVELWWWLNAGAVESMIFRSLGSLFWSQLPHLGLDAPAHVMWELKLSAGNYREQVSPTSTLRGGHRHEFPQVSNVQFLVCVQTFRFFFSRDIDSPSDFSHHLIFLLSQAI
jgi:hypothetical protein